MTVTWGHMRSCDPRVLCSMEQLSTEEESSDSGGEGGSDDELARNLESLLGGRKTSRQFSHEQEEMQRMELRKLLDKPVSADTEGLMWGWTERG